MGDVAVGARSGHDGEEHRGRPVEAPDPVADSAVTSGSDSGADEDGTAPGDATRTEEQGPGDSTPQPRKPRSFWKELPILVVIALVLALLIKTFLVQAFSIPSDSMQNTSSRVTASWSTSSPRGSVPSPSAVRSSSSTTRTTGWRASRRRTPMPCRRCSVGSA